MRTRPRSGSRLALVTAFGLALSSSFASVAVGKPPKKETPEATAARLEQAGLTASAAGDNAAAVRSLKQAARACEPPNACAAKTRARLHLSLGTVHGVGEGDFEAAKKEFVAALTLDPKVRLQTTANKKLSTAFEDARTEVLGPPETPPPPDKPAEPPPEKQPKINVTDLFHSDDAATPSPRPPKGQPPPPPPVEPGSVARFNWFSLRAMVDFAFISDANVCSPGAPGKYYCADESGARYTGHPQANDKVSNGFALSTGRLVLGYERLLVGGLTAGAFAGLAIPLGGLPAGRSAMSPFHYEARASYALGRAPFADAGDRFNPFAFVSLGVAQLDSHVSIRVNEIPCESKVAPACKRDLDVSRRTGNVFTTVGGGLRIRLEGRHALRAAVRAGIMLSDGTFLVSSELAYELGI